MDNLILYFNLSLIHSFKIIILNLLLLREFYLLKFNEVQSELKNYIKEIKVILYHLELH